MDHYALLGVKSDASDNDIKLAYRKLARTLHPDKGGDTVKFQKIQEAYSVLSDPDKRRNYDNKSRSPLNTFSGYTTQPPAVTRKKDVQFTLKTTLEEVYRGASRKIRVQRTRMCGFCNVKCNACSGAGNLTQHLNMGIFTQILQTTCSVCGGSGKLTTSGCTICSGSGNITETNFFQVPIEPGAQTGKRTVFKEWGEQATKFNQIPGDLVVTVHIEPHPHFTRRDLDLFYRQHVDLKTTLTGGIVTIPHFEGGLNLEVSGFGIINPNKEYIVFGKGLVSESGRKGNLHIVFVISYPERVLTETEIQKVQRVLDEIHL